MKRTTFSLLGVGWMGFAATWGCAGPGPKLFPPAPLGVRPSERGFSERFYDLDRDGRPDYYEELSGDGRVVVLRYDTEGDGRIDLEVERDGASTLACGGNRSASGESEHRIAASVIPDDCRRLVLLLDSIPYEMVRDLWEQGRFRLFHRPVRTIAPFPVMTDLSFSEFFGVAPAPGVESQYYNGQRLTDGYSAYTHRDNMSWLDCADYHLSLVAHPFAYLWAHAWFDHELRAIQQGFYRGKGDSFIGYCVGTSALGSQHGRDGHQAGLVRLDRFCQAVMHDMQGRVQITLLSDHGHNLIPSLRIPLTEVLSRCGYRVTDRLKNPEDVAVPSFGMVTCAAIHTRSAASVARDLTGVDGIDLTLYRDGDEVVILNRTGRARISLAAAGYRYVAERGDPLRMLPVLAELRQRGLVDAGGFVEDRALFEATVDHFYPDAVHRIWRAFHGLVVNTPDVLVSIQDGWYWGSETMAKFLKLAAAHGNLNPPSSTAFAMTTAGELPPVLRVEDLAAALEKLGVPIADCRLRIEGRFSKRR